MWCGDQLHRAYEMQQEKARASWQAEAQRRAAASQQLRTSQEMFVQMEVARWQEANPSLKHPASLIASAVADSVAQARTRLGNGATGTSGADELALRQARLRLRSLRMAAEGIVSHDALTAADNALKSSDPAAIHAAEQRLEQELEREKRQKEGDVLRARARARAENAANDARALLAAIPFLASAGAQVDQQTFEGLSTRLDSLSEHIERDPAHARDLLTNLRQEVEVFHSSVKNSYMAQWDLLQGDAQMLHGQLATLAEFLNEATTINMAAASADLPHRLASVRQELDQWSGTTGEAIQLNTARQRLDAIGARIKLLTDEVFVAIERRQQETIAQTIAQTLGTMGFVAESGATPPQAQKVGSQMHIVALKKGQDARGARDEKLVSFFVDPEGGVSYDFSGYKGDACVAAAHEIFERLRQNGLALLDPATSERISKDPDPAVALNPRAYLTNAPLPTFDVNLRQTHLRDRLLNVLHRMGFSHVNEESAGGTIILDAFNGNQGYRITLPPDSERDQPEVVERDASGRQMNVSGQDQHPVVQAMKDVPHQKKPVPAKKRHERVVAPQRSRVSQGN